MVTEALVDKGQRTWGETLGGCGLGGHRPREEAEEHCHRWYVCVCVCMSASLHTCASSLLGLRLLYFLLSLRCDVGQASSCHLPLRRFCFLPMDHWKSPCGPRN